MPVGAVCHNNETGDCASECNFRDGHCTMSGEARHSGWQRPGDVISAALSRITTYRRRPSRALCVRDSDSERETCVCVGACGRRCVVVLYEPHHDDDSVPPSPCFYVIMMTVDRCV